MIHCAEFGGRPHLAHTRCASRIAHGKPARQPGERRMIHCAEFGGRPGAAHPYDLRAFRVAFAIRLRTRQSSLFS